MANSISIIEQIKVRETKTLSDRINLGYSRVSMGLYRLSPNPVRRSLPTLVSKITLPVKEFPKVRQEVLEKFAEQDNKSSTDLIALEKETDRPKFVKTLYSQYRCVRQNPLNCDGPQRSIEDNSTATHCLQCGFPCLLPPETKIRGLQGSYQVGSYLKSRGRGRLYRGIDLRDRQPVTIREYLLPERCFSDEEMRVRQTQFLNLAGIELADGQVKDFRLLRPDEIFASPQERRCYAIASGSLETYLTLAEYLETTGTMSPVQVRSILLQGLQSLEFLHGQKFRFPSGVVQHGIFHGNLTLESSLFVPNAQGFYLYLADLGIWEHLFVPPVLSLPFISIQQDLKQLGEIAFFLLAGRAIDEETGYAPNPENPHSWPEIDPKFKTFILKLMGLKNRNFETAEIARQALLKLPAVDRLVAAVPLALPPEKKPKSKRKTNLWLWLVGGLGIALLGGLIWFLMSRSRQPSIATKTSPICCINQVAGIGAGNFTYVGVKTGIWTYILQQENLIAKGKTLEAELQQRIVPTEPPKDPPATEQSPPENASSPNPKPTEQSEPQFNLTYRTQATFSDAIAQVRDGKSNFAIASTVDNLDIYFGYEEFAYDAIAVYVAFSYAARKNSIPQHLNGQLSFEQLRQLYSGQIVNWKQLGGPDLPVKLYIPDDEDSIRFFENRVLKDRRAIAAFRSLIQPESATQRSDTFTPIKITQLSTFRSLKAVIRDFEDYNVGAISFGSLSKVFGQCSVYPLALVEKESSPISPLVSQENKDISPQTDLCNQKGSYRPNTSALASQRYPLTYPLAVIYPRDNRRAPVGQTFAEILNALEVQRLLLAAGLVPRQELPQPRQK